MALKIEIRTDGIYVDDKPAKPLFKTREEYYNFCESFFKAVAPAMRLYSEAKARSKEAARHHIVNAHSPRYRTIEDFMRGAKPSHLIADVSRSLYLEDWAKGQHIGETKKDLLSQGYKPIEIVEALRNNSPEPTWQQKQAQAWSKLGRQIVGAEVD